ncbi:hypothetical protein T4A_11151 [Trichinella pseudospiralis]|uniref:Uncharacterized protein n=1 Tax=Trichinella pseudospiralis TaxID=6337 RepID=A0A0V1EEK9_TRIPS|nr:hypothetical protein T4A_11151 [Trichinella pseudospiralis]
MTQLQMANDHLSQTSYSEVITQLPAVLMYLIFTISDSTRKRVLALLLLALCNSCLVVHGVKTAVSGPASAHEKGPTEEFIRPRDRQGSVTSIEQPANLKVSQGQAKACCEDTPSSATIVRGTCSGSARSNHECKANRPYKCTWQGAENDSKVKSI